MQVDYGDAYSFLRSWPRHRDREISSVADQHAGQKRKVVELASTAPNPAAACPACAKIFLSGRLAMIAHLSTKANDVHTRYRADNPVLL